MRPDVGKVIAYILENNAGVSALVGTKIFARRVPQRTALPYAYYFIVSSLPVDTKDRIASIDSVQVQIDMVAKTYAQVQALSDAVRTAIDGYAIGSTVAGVKMDGVRFSNERDDYDDDIDVHIKQADYFFRIKY